MILELFIALVLIALYMVWLGYKVQVQVYSMVGFLFIFLLSLVILTQNLQVQTGNTITSSNTTTTVVTYNYTAYTESSSHWIGYFLAVASAIGMILQFIQMPRGSVKV